MEISERLTRLIISGNIWGILFTRIKRVPDPSIGLAGMSFDEFGNLLFKYDEEKIRLMDEKNFLKLLEHEGIHVWNRHLQRGFELLENEMIIDKDFAEKYFQDLYQKSVDTAANDLAGIKSIFVGKEELPGHTPENHNVPKGKHFEFYFSEFRQRLKDRLEEEKKNEEQKCSGENNGDDKNEVDKSDQPGEDKKSDDDKSSGEGKSDIDEPMGPGEGKGQPETGESNQPGESDKVGNSGNTFDDHSGWKNSTGQQDENLVRKIDANIKKVTTDVLKQIRPTERGKLPGYVQEMINAILKEPEFPYYKMLQKYVRATKIAKYKTNYAKINRKRIYMFQDDDNLLMCPFPGKSRNLTFKVVILIDTSMSMTIEDVMEALASCQNIIMSDRYCEITVIEVDTKIQKEYKIKRLSDIDMSVKGRGGTHLEEAFKRSAELESDVTIVFTDGYTEDIKNHSKLNMPKKIIYVIPKSGSDKQILGTGLIVRRND